jgi:hypothetical protein
MPLKQVGLGFGMMPFWNRIATVIAAPLVGLFLQTIQSITLTWVFISAFALVGAGFASFSFTKKPYKIG